MIEIECPFCDEPCTVAADEFGGPSFALHCPACATETEVIDASPEIAVRLAA